MEVHAHTHTPRKKWFHYFWEFLMLFLAVTLGFFVENQREHMMEHQRERRYMELMTADLEIDITEMLSISNEIENRLLSVDSMLKKLTVYPLPKENIEMSYHYTFPSLNNLTFKFNDRTITQLKNSGNMRLIRNQQVNDGIIHYWNEFEKIKQASDRHSVYRAKGRDMETKIFNTAELYLNNNRHLDGADSIGLINPDPLLVKEYANVIADVGVMLGAIRINIRNQLKIAEELIIQIKKEYHLK